MLLLQLHPMGRKGNRSTDISEYRKGYEDRCREVFSLPEQHCLKQNPYSFNIAEKEAACNLFFIPFLYFLSSSFRTLMKASCGISTFPTCRMRFLPSFCFSRSFFFLVMSPP